MCQKMFLLLLLVCPFPVYAQENLGAIDEYNVPKEVEVCVKSVAGVTMRGDINPFYLSGDFDGDGRLDFAVQVKRASAKGILMCLSSQRLPVLIGAGSSILWPASQPWRFDAWSVVPKSSKFVSPPPRLPRDALLLDIKETASGLLYWDGQAFAWKQLSD